MPRFRICYAACYHRRSLKRTWRRYGLRNPMAVGMTPEVAEAGFTYPSLLGEIRRGGLTISEIGQIAGVGERQVQNWLSGTSKPSPESRDRLVDIRYVVGQLLDVYRPEGVEIWIHSRNPELSGQRPIELLIDGQFDAVLAAVDRLRSGAM